MAATTYRGHPLKYLLATMQMRAFFPFTLHPNTTEQTDPLTSDIDSTLRTLLSKTAGFNLFLPHLAHRFQISLSAARISK